MASDREIASKLPTLESSIYLIEKALFLSVYLRTNVYSTLFSVRWIFGNDRRCTVENSLPLAHPWALGASLFQPIVHHPKGFEVARIAGVVLLGAVGKCGQDVHLGLEVDVVAGL